MRIISQVILLGTLLVAASDVVAQGPTATPGATPMTYVSGDAIDLVPLGHLDEVAVAILGPPDSIFGSTRIPVVVRNNTELTVESVDVAIVVRDSTGTMIAVTETGSLYPYRVPPGEIAFGEAYLSNTTLPADATFETLVTSEEEGEGCCGSLLTVVSALNLGERIVGEVRNDSTEEESYAFVQVLCFQGGSPSATYSGSVVGDELAPGATGAFQVDMYDTCEKFLIAAS